MTFQSLAHKELPVTSGSSHDLVSLHLFQCGQGDTVLLGFSNGKWVLVDCNLPTGDVRREFFETTARLNISRLDLICLTHAHDDHYTGMEAVIRHFTSGGRSVGVFCDGGPEPKQIATLMRRKSRPTSSILAYESLYRCVWDLIKAKKISYFRADENSRSIYVGDDDSMQIVPLGPRAAIAGIAVRETLLPVGRIRQDINLLSVILALCIRKQEGAFDALLAADADAAGINFAIESVEKLVPSAGYFDMIKVSHHGSLASHKSCFAHQRKKAGVHAVAAVSSGHFDVLPDRAVLNDYLTEGWNVLLTTKRVAPQASSTPLTLSGKSDVFSILRQNLHLSWNPTDGLRWSPDQALMHRDELKYYKTAD